MKLCKVVGSVVSTIKDERLKGYKLLIVQGYSVLTKETTGCPFVALDTAGAGEGDLVIIVSGTPAQYLVGDGKIPIDSAIIGIIDSFSI